MTKKIVLIVLCVVLAPVFLLVSAFALMAFLFSLVPATMFTEADVTIAIKDDRGSPIKNSIVELWRYEYPDIVARTDENGIATFANQSYQYGKNIYMFWVDRPKTIPIRVRVPELSPLYYRFDIVGDGPVKYDVFNSDYDYYFGEEWIGQFDGQHQTRTTIWDTGNECSAVAPETTDGKVQLWNPSVMIRKMQPPNVPFAIHLDLVQSRIWSADED